ncbi:MAG TPA: hypothetical protein VFU42_01520, partial [Candidatus Deferrimicrobiaceae bacterium]|nr:hypothetical protein [Candidatus Deferrimicrobiaceae bacterium]
LLFGSPEEAAGAREKIVRGASPDDVAKRFSSGEGPPIDADLGFLTREELPGEVAAELFQLPAGGVSRVIPRDKTHSLFLVVQKSPSGSLSYGEKAPEIRQELERRRREAAFRSWLDAQVAKAEVQIQEGILAKLSEERK